ncbi:MAG: methyl-accepting chemotaxis protein [Pseudomonas sp.]|uniref:methyl-accepting chemotaxis protein n=1 Tax=Pseudomonas sp. TaxID=306 RepID=UPI00339B2A4E
MLSNIRIQHKLYAGFAAIIVLLVLLLLIAHDNLNQLTEANAWDRHTSDVLLGEAALDETLLETRNSVRTYWYTGDASAVDSLQEQLRDLEQDHQHLRQLVADNPAQVARLARLYELTDVWKRSVVVPLMDKRMAGGLSAEVLTQEPLIRQGGTALMAIRTLLHEFSGVESQLQQERAERTEALRKNLVLVLTFGGLACIVLAAVIATLLSRAILRPINALTDSVSRIAAGEAGARAEVLNRDELGLVTEEFNRMAQAIQDNQAREQAATDLLRSNVDALLAVVSRAAAGDLTGTISVHGEDAVGQLGSGLQRMLVDLRAMLLKVQRAGIAVTSSTTEIAASSRQQEATSIEQAQTSVEVLSTTKEISANAQALVKTMEEVVQVADETTGSAEQARSNLGRMDQTMQRMVLATDSINDKLAALSEKASNINKVLTTITKVADQTNLLSLNAAIEAEKAGEAGRGFSVVATEIRRLSDQTSVATWDIEQMLKDMHSAVSASVMGMDKFSEEIRRSVGEVATVSDQLADVIEEVQKLPSRIEIALEGMQAQAVGAGQIAETIMQLNDSAQQTSEALKATSEAVLVLQQAAQDLQSSVSTFSVNA